MSETWALPTSGFGLTIPCGLGRYVAGWCRCEVCVAGRDAFERAYVAKRRQSKRKAV